MFEIKCHTGATLTLPELRAFQGNLKTRSAADIDVLIASIRDDGLLMPIAVWKNEEINNVLDGHARLEALIKMAIADPAILTVNLPILYIEANDEEQARAALLQITSQYGRVTKKGLATFSAPIVNYKVCAPIMKVLSPPPVSMSRKTLSSDEVILKLRIKKDVVKRLTEVLSGVEGVTIL